MSEIKYIGQMSSSQNSRVIDPEGISYAVTNGHKDGEPKIIEPIGCAMRGRNPENPSERGRSNGKYKQRIEMGSNISNTITSVQKDSLVAEPNVLTPKRTDFGKQVRKQYESGELDMSRHDMTELEPRTDGVSNTLTSVQKDNLVAEPIRDTDGCIQVGNIYPDSENMPNRSGGRVYSKEGCSPTILSRDFKTPKLVAEPTIQQRPHGFNKGGEHKIAPTVTGSAYHENNLVSEPKPDECHLVGGSWDGWQDERVFDDRGSSPTLDTNSEKRPRIQGAATSYRIRKLTPRECFRLMGVTETDIDKIQQSGVSQSQQYKMAGNSIVVDCLYHMFRKMFTETACESQQLSLF